MKPLLGLPKMEAELECNAFCSRNCLFYKNKKVGECISARHKAKAGVKDHGCVLLLQLHEIMVRERWGLDRPRLGL